jgi:putative ABC transport system ATP-binding protein
MNLENICKEFKKNKKTIKVLVDINYNFETAKFYAIFGQSGSGKTTLINILGMLENPTSGNYIFNDINTTKINKEKKCELRNKNIGYVLQNINLNESLNAIENVELPMLINKNISLKDRKNIAKKLLEKFGLNSRTNHYPKELSGGERQRVCIARALANNPKVILCDEPTSSLDKTNTKKVFSLLKQLSSEGYCVIVVSHDDTIFNYADICLELKNGNLFEVTK